jgi:hypothetical protein
MIFLLDVKTLALMEGKILFFNCHGLQPVAIKKKIGMTAGDCFKKKLQ